jgi:hypothetical protein
MVGLEQGYTASLTALEQWQATKEDKEHRACHWRNSLSQIRQTLSLTTQFLKAYIFSGYYFSVTIA